MKEGLNLDLNFEFFSGKRVDDIVILNFGETPIIHLLDLNVKESLFEYLRLVEKDDSVKIVLIIGSSQKMEHDEYLEFYKHIVTSGSSVNSFERLFNAINQVILRFTSFNKIIIHADSGNIIPPFLNISLACDYRIVGEDTVFQNPSMKLGLVPKGGGVFFLSNILGPGKTIEYILSGKDISAQEAMSMGIVDKVVPPGNLNEVALSVARDFSQPSVYLLSGIKKLVNISKKDLANCLETEDDILRDSIRSAEFRKVFDE
ncbi:MAG: enoyl-CoA hydratase/isomerase family protein [Desulfobacterales bacterium]|jgi:2-(1,2-epoxy-1,2-dihydrophenyl)acetyl-CoA isomerase|nr:enoyl-CoA hydratase/isomerase family protein [Desulfobacteraceae bacterium]MBT4365563.1 enoyl-CoA hydratase/isomerase family protein [Desulfobacteraceae bacterium]MBT7086308.1 enoyl-CoA hydratase/isomerase family protein [Desulfobacterales bacterium]